jgi:hypothetical protein
LDALLAFELEKVLAYEKAISWVEEPGLPLEEIPVHFRQETADLYLSLLLVVEEMLASSLLWLLPPYSLVDLRV